MTLIPIPPPVPPYRIPDVIIDGLKALVSAGDLPSFKTALETYLSANSHLDIDIGDPAPVLGEATRQDKADFVTELMDFGFGINYAHVIQAIELKAKKTLGVFLNLKKWDINKPVSATEPPVLGWAVKDEEMALWLIENGADPNQKTFIDVTPLSWAVLDSPIDVLEKLLNQIGDVREGELLQHAVDRKSSDAIQVIDMLLAKKAKLNSLMYEKDDGGRRMFHFMGNGTVLHRAAEAGKMDIVRHLIEKGVDKDINDTKGKTVAERAEESGHFEVAKYLESL